MGCDTKDTHVYLSQIDYVIIIMCYICVMVFMFYVVSVLVSE